MNVEQEELISRTEVKDSPFMIIGMDPAETGEKIYFGALGKFRLTENMGSEAEVAQDLKQLTWNRLIQVMTLVFDSLNDEEYKQFLKEEQDAN